MSKKETIEERAWELLCEVCEPLGIAPVDAEYVKEGTDYKLLLYLDKPGGINIEDCETVSRTLDPILDREDFIPDAYTMIVSSPGLGRNIRRPRDFVFAKGKEVDVRTFVKIGEEKELTGILAEYDKDSITLDQGENTIMIARKDIAKISLTVTF